MMFALYYLILQWYGETFRKEVLYDVNHWRSHAILFDLGLNILVESKHEWFEMHLVFLSELLSKIHKSRA